MKLIHQDIKQFLSSLGLTSTETVLYVASLQFGKQSAMELAKRSGVKRTTAHSALSSLVEKGMVGIHSQSGTSYFTATDPNLIERGFVTKIDNLKRQQLDFINLLPLFEDLAGQTTSTTETVSFHGEAGVRTAVDIALYCVSRQWKIIAPERNLFSEGEKEYADYFIRTRKQRGIKAKSLWEPAFIKGRTFDATAFEFRDPRVLSQKLAGKFKSTVIIFDSSVLFVNSAKELSAVVIKSSEVKETIEVLFDGLWKVSSPIPKRNMKKLHD